MVRTAQRVAIVVAIAATIIGYLYHAPNSEGIAQMNRVRVVAATMKVFQSIVCSFVFILFYNICHVYSVQRLNYLVCLIVFQLFENSLRCYPKQKMNKQMLIFM
jgi:dolichyl-phosphate-mannose--protein O-mannosyl transferase